MSFWQEHDFETKILDILRDVPLVGAGRFSERPFLTVYQLAIEIAQRHPESVEAAGWPIGGAGSGKGYSLAQYLAGNLARYVRNHPQGPIERVLLSNLQVDSISFSYGEVSIHSSVTATSPALALYRWRESRETPTAAMASKRGVSRDPAPRAGADPARHAGGIVQITTAPGTIQRVPRTRRMRLTSSITELTVGDWRERLANSNARAMQKRHQYPPCEGAFLLHCCTFQEPACPADCFCRQVGNDGVWTLRPDLAFDAFLDAYANLWVTGLSSFKNAVNDPKIQTGARWRFGMQLLREVKVRWSDWDGQGHSLPELASQVRRCFFCDDAFDLIAPFVESIRELYNDGTGIYTSKLVSQLFYDIAVPFDNASKGLQKRYGYNPLDYGAGSMREDVKRWLEKHRLSIPEFRRLDDAPSRYWRQGERPEADVGTACSRVLDKLFYG